MDNVDTGFARGAPHAITAMNSTDATHGVEGRRRASDTLPSDETTTTNGVEGRRLGSDTITSYGESSTTTTESVQGVRRVSDTRTKPREGLYKKTFQILPPARREKK